MKISKKHRRLALIALASILLLSGLLWLLSLLFTQHPEMVKVKGGDFVMGSPEDEVGRGSNEYQRSLRIASMWVSEREITQGQWLELMQHNPSDTIGEDLPVHNINFFDALAYCNALSAEEGYAPCYDLSSCEGTPGDDFGCSERVPPPEECEGFRIPTEAEWEYFARANSQEATYAGNLDHTEESAVLDDIAWYKANASGPQVGGQLQPNDFGLYDCLGNLWEWTWDSYSALTNPNAYNDPVLSETGWYRVIRGGGYNAPARNCRAATRGRVRADFKAPYLGFRVVRSLL